MYKTIPQLILLCHSLIYDFDLFGWMLGLFPPLDWDHWKMVRMLLEPPSPPPLPVKCSWWWGVWWSVRPARRVTWLCTAWRLESSLVSPQSDTNLAPSDISLTDTDTKTGTQIVYTVHSTGYNIVPQHANQVFPGILLTTFCSFCICGNVGGWGGRVVITFCRNDLSSPQTGSYYFSSR